MQPQQGLQWEKYGKYGKTWVALDGAEIVCIVAQPEGAPLEMFAVQFHENCFTTLEAAKEHVEKVAREEKDGPKSKTDALMVTLLPVLKMMIAAYEAKNGVNVPEPVAAKV